MTVNSEIAWKVWTKSSIFRGDLVWSYYATRAEAEKWAKKFCTECIYEIEPGHYHCIEREVIVVIEDLAILETVEREKIEQQIKMGIMRGKPIPNNPVD